MSYSNKRQGVFWAGGLLVLAGACGLHAGTATAAASLDGASFSHGDLTTTPPARAFGMLKSDTPLIWPKALRELSPPREALTLRKRIEQRVRAALEQARYGPVDRDVVQQLNRDVRQLGVLFKQTTAELSFPEYIEAKRFLTALSAALDLLPGSGAPPPPQRK